jgi:PAS domain S-box-containing protein
MQNTSSVKRKPPAMRYGLAILAAIVALLLRKLLAPLLGTHTLYLGAWPAVVFSAWYCGIGPSIVSILITLLGTWYLFIPVFHSFTLEEPRTAISGMVFFLLISSFIVALGEANRRSKASSERGVAERRRIEDELREAQTQLENRVQERTAELNIANQNLCLETARVKAQAEWLDAANDAIFVGGSDETITYWNKGAERLYGWSRAEALGKNPHTLLQTEFPVPFAEIAKQRQRRGWEGELVHTKRDGSKVTVASRWTPLKDDNNTLSGWVEINRDITDRKAVEAARQLNAQLLKVQDEERRKIARELYDSTGQMVIASMLNLARLKVSANLTPEEKRLLSSCDAMLQSVSSELRTISHLLHPPLLDEVGLCTALEWYVEGFKRRSGIATTLERNRNFGRLNSDLEVTIFRVAQECLTNVHRHSGSSEASVRLLRSNAEVRLEVKDRGRGIPEEVRSMAPGDGTGVGLSGMRERIYQLGGNLSVESSGNGTAIVAIFPVAEKAAEPEKAVNRA